MSNPFARFGIEHLSPSSLNTYAANPALWCGKYLMGWKDDMGPSAHRGTAVEAGLDVFLFRDRSRPVAEVLEAATQIAYQTFARLTNGLADLDHESERGNLEPMLLQAVAGMKNAPVPVARQVRVEHYVDGIEVPIIGFCDYVFEDYGLDLKTTKACPSSIKSDHGRQIALYSKAKAKPFKLFYVTGKRNETYPLGDNEAALHLRDLERHARAVRHLLSKASDARDAARIFAPEFTDFRWSDKTRALADELYRPI